MKKYSTILLLFVIVTSCEEEKVYKVDPALQPYVDSFYQEASDRGKTLPKDNLIVGLTTAVQAYTSVGNGDGQKYIHFNENAFGYLSEIQIEYHLYEAMAPIFLGKSIRPILNDMELNYTEDSREQILDRLFE